MPATRRPPALASLDQALRQLPLEGNATLLRSLDETMARAVASQKAGAGEAM